MRLQFVRSRYKSRSWYERLHNVEKTGHRFHVKQLRTWFYQWVFK